MEYLAFIIIHYYLCIYIKSVLLLINNVILYGENVGLSCQQHLLIWCAHSSRSDAQNCIFSQKKYLCKYCGLTTYKLQLFMYVMICTRTGCPIGLVHCLQIYLDEFIDHVEPINPIHMMKALLSEQLLTYWPVLQLLDLGWQEY
jgi:hypothetical protein